MNSLAFELICDRRGSFLDPSLPLFSPFSLSPQNMKPESSQRTKEREREKEREKERILEMRRRSPFLWCCWVVWHTPQRREKRERERGRERPPPLSLSFFLWARFLVSFYDPIGKGGLLYSYMTATTSSTWLLLHYCYCYGVVIWSTKIVLISSYKCGSITRQCSYSDKRRQSISRIPIKGSFFTISQYSNNRLMRTIYFGL